MSMELRHLRYFVTELVAVWRGDETSPALARFLEATRMLSAKLRKHSKGSG